MLSYCVKSIIKWRPLGQCCNVLGSVNRTYASFSVRDILYETSDEAGTLLTRFAKHIAIERLNMGEQAPTKVRYADFFPVSDMRYFQKELFKTPADQLPSVIVYAFSYRSNADPVKFASILNEIDRYAMLKVHEMDLDTILSTLYAFLFLMPNWMTRLDFYTEAMRTLFEIALQDGCASKELFVQMSFYFGLSKKNSRGNLNKYWKSFVDSHLDTFLPNLSLLDMALVANAGFKTSTKIDSHDFCKRLVQEVLGISSADGGNDALLITFIKTLRFQRVYSKELLEHMSQICASPQKLQQFQIRGQTHIFALFADNLWDNEECTQPMINEFIRHLKTSTKVSYAETMRGKDIARFLWCCSQLKCKLSNDQLRMIEDSLLRKFHNNEFNYFPDQLIESCLSLWILGYKSKELLQSAIQLKTEFPSKRHQPKVDSRLTVLLSAAQIEEPAWCTHLTKGFKSFNLHANVPEYNLNSAIPYNSLLSQLNEGHMVECAKIVSPINGINIPGIYVQLTSSDTPLFVEFLTKPQMLQFSQQPVGILRLKIQLLKSMGHNVKVMTADDMSKPLNVNDFLADEISSELSENIIKA